MPARPWRDILACAAVAGWALFAYRDSFGVYFINEDFTWMRLCRFGPAQGVGTLLMRDVMSGIYSWRPLLQLSFAVDYAAFGVNPLGYRWDSMLWLGLGAWLLMAIGVQVADRLRGVLAAVLFVAHPLLVESVSWTCARSGLIYTVLSLCAVLGMLRWRERNGSPLLVGVPFALALGAQESAVIVPVLLLAADLLLPGGVVPARRRLGLYLMLGVVLLAFLWLRRVMSPASLNLTIVGLDPRLPVTPLGIVTFLAAKARATAALLLMLEPAPVGLVATVTAGPLLVWPLVAAVVLAAGVLWWNGRPVALWGVLWIAIALAPYSLLLLGPFARYMVLPLAGFALVFAELIAATLQGSWRASGVGRGRPAVWVCMSLCLMLWLGRVVRTIDGQQAGFVTRGDQIRRVLLDLLRALPDPRPGSTLAFYGMGDLVVHQGVFVYGLEDAVRLFYSDDSLRVELRPVKQPTGDAYRLWYHDGRLQRLDGDPTGQRRSDG